MFNFNIFSNILKNKKGNSISDEERLRMYKFEMRMQYVRARYPSFNNSDYVKLLDKEMKKWKVIF